MDQVVVDLEGDSAAAGDEVVLFGPGNAGEPTADDWAAAVGTINYEIVTWIDPPRTASTGARFVSPAPAGRAGLIGAAIGVLAAGAAVGFTAEKLAVGEIRLRRPGGREVRLAAWNRCSGRRYRRHAAARRDRRGARGC